MSDITKQKVYEAAKRWVADAEQPLDELIAAIREHRTEEAKADTAEPVQEPAPTDPPDAA